MDEEAYYYYKKYRNEYEDARMNKKNAESQLYSYSSKKRAAESSLSSCRTEKKNLEKRLEDVNRIIACFDRDAASNISRANNSAKRAGESYCRAIRCSTIANADITIHFRTRSVSEDSNSDSAYCDCVKEKRRLEDAISDLADQINNLNDRIETLASNMRSCSNAIADYTGSMNTARNKANYYADCI